MAEKKPLISNGDTPIQSSTIDNCLNPTYSNNLQKLMKISYTTVQDTRPSNSTVSKVTCAVCQEIIDVVSNNVKNIIKCNRCNETTPIGCAPAGKMYVRCLCHCLLICNTTSQRIACPRSNCKRIMNLSPNVANCPAPRIPGLYRVTCVHCQETFLFNVLQNALAKCPHCLRVSSVGPEFVKVKRIFFSAVSVVLSIVLLIVTTFRRLNQLTDSVFFYVMDVVIIIIILVTVCKFLYYFGVKVSTIDGPV